MIYFKVRKVGTFALFWRCDVIILGIDPGYAIVGFGIVKYECNKFTPIEFGAITTPANMPFCKRLDKIFCDLSEILEKYKVDALSIEKLFFNTNTTTAIDVAQARGVIVLAAQRHLVDVFEYTPLQVKQAVTGYGRAEKKQIQEMTRIMLGLQTVPKPDDTADALALAICHGHSAGSIIGRLNYKCR